MPAGDGGLGESLVGEKITINHRHVSVAKLLGEGTNHTVITVLRTALCGTISINAIVELRRRCGLPHTPIIIVHELSLTHNTLLYFAGGFSYVYLVKETSESLSNTVHGDNGGEKKDGNVDKTDMVLKVTSILSRQQRDIAEKEAKLLSRLSHPSIIKMYDTCYRTVPGSGGLRKKDEGKSKDRPQHLILMEFCEGGAAMDVCTSMATSGERFDLSTLIIAFGQICNAVSYLHAQRPPIVHRDLKPANFLVKNGAYKLCDFGSAVFGHVDLKTPANRNEAEEVIQKTTTQMFRAPEMVDLYMAKKLTQATDVWALGACLYSLAFLQNCYEEGSNLAILSNKYKIPEDNPYGEGLVELLDRMLTIDVKGRADMTEVILCLSAVYSGRPLPPRKEKKKDKEKEKDSKGSKSKSSKKKNDGAGTYRTDGQGIVQEESLEIDPDAALAKTTEVKKLNPNSAAARRRKAAGGSAALPASAAPTDDFGISKMDNPFASAEISETASSIFGSFEGKSETGSDAIEGAFGADQNWSNLDPEAFEGPDDEAAPPQSKSNGGRERSRMKITAPRPRSRSTGSRKEDDSPKVATTHRRGHSGERGRSSRADDAEAAGDAPEKRRHRTSSRSRGLLKKHANKDKGHEGDDSKPRRSGTGSGRSRREAADDPA
jgi:serine/threonine protein kinase